MRTLGAVLAILGQKRSRVGEINQRNFGRDLLLLGEDSIAVLPAVTGEIGLRIAIDIEFAHHSPSRNRRFPD